MQMCLITQKVCIFEWIQDSDEGQSDFLSGAVTLKNTNYCTKMCHF